jgi:hypothetical protein
MWFIYLVRVMNVIKEGSLKGTFTGFSGSGTLLEFMDGTRWRQSDATVHPFRSLTPIARVFLRRGKYFVRVHGIASAVAVVPDI